MIESVIGFKICEFFRNPDDLLRDFNISCFSGGGGRAFWSETWTAFGTTIETGTTKTLLTRCRRRYSIFFRSNATLLSPLSV